MTFAINKAGKPNDDMTLKLHNECTNKSGNCNCPTINKVSKTKYLGIIIDEYIKWDAHIKFLCDKLKYVSYKFYKINKIIGLKNLKTIYYALVQSLLQYGLVIWGGAFDSHINDVFTTQKLIIKTILNRPKIYPTDLIFKEFNVMTIRQLYIKSVISYINKYKTNFSYTNNTVTGSYLLRPESTCRYKTYHTNITAIRKQIKYTSTKLINIIPSHFITVSNKYKKLMPEIVNWITGKYFYNLDINI